MLTTIVAASLLLAPAHPKVEFKGMYVEGCSCAPPCACELTGLEMGCQGVGAFAISQGTFNGQDVSGVKIAYATMPGKWVICYYQADTPEKRKAASAFAQAAFKAFGKIQSTTAANISFAGSAGKYRVTVNGGKVMDMTTVPIMGGDKKTPLVYNNINDPLHPTVMQGKVVKCSYKDRRHSFKLSDSNAYFNPRLDISTTL